MLRKYIKNYSTVIGQDKFPLDTCVLYCAIVTRVSKCLFGYANELKKKTQILMGM